MECVSSMPLATCLAVPHNATQEYGIGGVQNPWTFNSSHAALWDCMSQWTFGKGTATSHGHHFYLESPPISPRSGPTQLGTSVPDLILEEEVDNSDINADLPDTADTSEETKLDRKNDRNSEHPRTLISSPGVGGLGPLQGTRFSLGTGSPMDCSEATLPSLQLDGSSTFRKTDVDDNVKPRKSSVGLVGQAEPTEATQVLPMPSELNTIVHELGEGNRNVRSITRPMSPQICRSGTSTTEIMREPTGDESELLANDNDPCAERDPGVVLLEGHTIGDLTSRSDDHTTLLSPATRQVWQSRVKENSRRWPRLPTKTRVNDTQTPKHDMRMRVDKRRQADLRKRHSRLHGSHSVDSEVTTNQSSNSDRSDSAHTFWEERKSCSVSGNANTTEFTGLKISGHLSAIPCDQISSEAGLLPDETSVESPSSCDETETDVSDMEEPHPLDPKRDQIVSLLLQRYISSRTESHKQLEDTDSRSNGTASASKASGGRPQSKTSGAKQATGQKRKRDSDSQDDDSIGDDDEASPRRRKRPKETSKDSTEQQSFACPFSKKAPSKYRRCYRYDLKRIRDVKQHLRRCHRRAVYCPVCSETFSNEEARDIHVRQRNCTENPGFTVEGLSEAQAQSLSGKCSTKVPPKEQWFQVFDICFPDHAHPRSPYVDRNLSEELQSFRDFASTEGPSIILEHVQGFRDLNEQDTAFLRRALSESLECIADRWSQGLDSESTPELGTTSSTATVPRSSPLGSSARQSTPLHASGPARDLQGGVALASSVGNMQEQLLGISSGDKGQHGVEATQVDGIYDFGAELFDFSMLSTGAPVATAPGEIEYPLDVWTLRYGPNVELTT